MTVSAENVTVPYDGQAHGITVSVTDPASGAVVKYGTAEGTYDLDVRPEIMDAGTLAGRGSVRANGAGSTYVDCRGGGGRVAVKYDDASGFDLTLDLLIEKLSLLQS